MNMHLALSSVSEKKRRSASSISPRKKIKDPILQNEDILPMNPSSSSLTPKTVEHQRIPFSQEQLSHFKKLSDFLADDSASPTTSHYLKGLSQKELSSLLLPEELPQKTFLSEEVWRFLNDDFASPRTSNYLKELSQKELSSLLLPEELPQKTFLSEEVWTFLNDESEFVLLQKKTNLKDSSPKKDSDTDLSYSTHMDNITNNSSQQENMVFQSVSSSVNQDSCSIVSQTLKDLQDDYIGHFLKVQLQEDNHTVIGFKSLSEWEKSAHLKSQTLNKAKIGTKNSKHNKLNFRHILFLCMAFQVKHSPFYNRKTLEHLFLNNKLFDEILLNEDFIKCLKDFKSILEKKYTIDDINYYDCFDSNIDRLERKNQGVIKDIKQYIGDFFSSNDIEASSSKPRTTGKAPVIVLPDSSSESDIIRQGDVYPVSDVSSPPFIAKQNVTAEKVENFAPVSLKENQDATTASTSSQLRPFYIDQNRNIPYQQEEIIFHPLSSVQSQDIISIDSQRPEEHQEEYIAHFHRVQFQKDGKIAIGFESTLKQNVTEGTKKFVPVVFEKNSNTGIIKPHQFSDVQEWLDLAKVHRYTLLNAKNKDDEGQTIKPKRAMTLTPMISLLIVYQMRNNPAFEKFDNSMLKNMLFDSEFLDTLNIFKNELEKSDYTVAETRNITFSHQDIKLLQEENEDRRKRILDELNIFKNELEKSNNIFAKTKNIRFGSQDIERLRERNEHIQERIMELLKPLLDNIKESKENYTAPQLRHQV